MGWRNEVNMDNIVMAAAPYGGPIATKRDENKIVKGSGQPIISIYSGSGKQMASIKVQYKHITLQHAIIYCIYE